MLLRQDIELLKILKQVIKFDMMQENQESLDMRGRTTTTGTIPMQQVSWISI